MDERDFWRSLTTPPEETKYSSIEVSADIRQAAKAARELYVAFRQEGFTEREALALVGAMFTGGRGES